MKKDYVLAMLAIPLCLLLVIGLSRGQQQAMGPSYSLETQDMPVAEIGKLLERLGKEIQKSNSITVGGKTFPMTGKGGLEFFVNSRQQGSVGVGIEFGSGRTEISKKWRTFVAYDVGSRGGTPEELADFVAKMGKTLASKGAFVIEDHSVALEGTATVEQKLVERTAGRGNRPPYAFTLSVMFGEKEFPLPEDEEDDVEAEKRGDLKELAKQEMSDADQEAIVKLFDSISSDLKAGKVKVGEKAMDVGENIMFSVSHLVATDGSSDRVQVGFVFGDVPPRKRSTGPRYSKELFDEPMKKVGALLKRLGTEILETGGFKLEETEFKVKDFATYEISASERGFSIELGYTEQKKE
jgi:hypothetical protein